MKKELSIIIITVISILVIVSAYGIIQLQKEAELDKLRKEGESIIEKINVQRISAECNSIHDKLTDQIDCISENLRMLSAQLEIVTEKIRALNGEFKQNIVHEDLNKPYKADDSTPTFKLPSQEKLSAALQGKADDLP